MVNRLEALRVPTICRLQGGVYGGSTDLALACDFRIGHAGVEMFMPAGRLGVHYYEAGMRRYVSRLGLNAAKRLFLTAERIDAAEMLRIGYLTDLVPDEAGLDPAVDALAGRIAGLAPLAVQGMKRALNEIAHGALDVPALEARQVSVQRERGSEGGPRRVLGEAGAGVPGALTRWPSESRFLRTKADHGRIRLRGGRGRRRRPGGGARAGARRARGARARRRRGRSAPRPPRATPR